MPRLRRLSLIFAILFVTATAFSVPKVCVLGLAEWVVPTAFEQKPLDEKIKVLEALEKKSPVEVDKALQVRDHAVPLHGSIIGIQPVKKSDSAGGLENFGIYTYTDPAGVDRVVKVLDFGPTQTMSNDLRNTLLGSYLMEKAGGPRIHGFGKVELSVGGKRSVHYYLDMEKLPDGISLKALDAANVGSALVPGPESREKTATQAAKRLLDVFAARLSPSDPDLWIMPAGDVRWIDGPRWRRTDFSKADTSYLAKIVWYLTDRLTLLDERVGDAPPPVQHGRLFIDTFFKGLKDSGLTAAERNRLREHFLDLHELGRAEAFERGYVKKILVRCGIIPSARVDLDAARQALESHLKGLTRP